MKYHFVIVGSGWRAMYYVRVAKALKDIFLLDAMLVRTEEKATRIADEMGIYTTTSIEECENFKPDFVVVAVNKSSIKDVSKEWMAKGFTVLCETPAAIGEEALLELWKLHTDKGCKLCVAEQYFRYPTYQAMLSVIESGILGEPVNVNMSLAHEYHGASLIKRILNTENETFKVIGKRYSHPVKETANRYEQFTDGRVAQKSRDIITIEFENGKTAFYDFSSEQYRSSIRSNYLKVQGVNGELQAMGKPMITEIHYLNENNLPEVRYLKADERKIYTGNANPNLNEIVEVQCVKSSNSLETIKQGENVYEPKEFGLCGLAEDETAIASMMLGAARYNAGGKELYSLKDALTDAYMAGLMQEAIKNPGVVIQSRKQPWQE